MTANPTEATPTGTCRVCGQVRPIRRGFIVRHSYDAHRPTLGTCQGSGDVSREYSEAHKMTEDELFGRFEDS